MYPFLLLSPPLRFSRWLAYRISQILGNVWKYWEIMQKMKESNLFRSLGMETLMIIGLIMRRWRRVEWMESWLRGERSSRSVIRFKLFSLDVLTMKGWGQPWIFSEIRERRDCESIRSHYLFLSSLTDSRLWIRSQGISHHVNDSTWSASYAITDSSTG